MKPRTRLALTSAAAIAIWTAARRWDGGRSRTIRGARAADLADAERRHPAGRKRLFTRRDERVLAGLEDFPPPHFEEST